MLKVEPSSATRRRRAQRVRRERRQHGDVAAGRRGAARELEDAERQPAATRPRSRRPRPSSSSGNRSASSRRVAASSSGVELDAGADRRARPGSSRPRAAPGVAVGPVRQHEHDPLGRRRSGPGSAAAAATPRRPRGRRRPRAAARARPRPAAAARPRRRTAAGGSVSPLQATSRRTARARARRGRVVQPVEQRRVAAAQVARAPRAPARRATGPRPPRPRRGRPASRARRASATARSSTADLPTPGGPVTSTRAAAPGVGPVQPLADPVAHVVAARRAGAPGRLGRCAGGRRGGRLARACAQPHGLGRSARCPARGAAPAPAARAGAGPPRTSPRSACCAGQREVRLLVGGVLGRAAPPTGRPAAAGPGAARAAVSRASSAQGS